MDIVGAVTAPARLSFRIAEFGVRTAGFGVRAGVHLLRGILPGGEEPEASPAGPTVEERPRPQPAEAPRAPRAAHRPTVPPVPAVEDSPPPEPAHVDEGATVVAEFAEDGAEEGAGAEIELAEPWEGYDRQRADEIRARLSDASAETIAAVTLYERAGRERASVIKEAERLLQRRTSSGPA